MLVDDTIGNRTGAGFNEPLNGVLRPDALLSTAAEVERLALQSGAMQPIPAEQRKVVDGGIEFVVWLLTRKKTKQRRQVAQDQKPAYSEKGANPFLPYDPRIFVGKLSESHVCLLNKYNILDQHLLIVTRQFEHQTAWLTEQDFVALWRCMQEVDGLTFYNGGQIAGASQRHKHLQLTPFISGSEESALPITPALHKIEWRGDVGRMPAFPFVHAIGRLEADDTQPLYTSATCLLECYHALLSACALDYSQDDCQSQPYNLLATRRWMMIVPRSVESYLGISVNALGFAGSLMARNQDQLRAIQEVGPIKLLQHVAQPYQP